LEKLFFTENDAAKYPFIPRAARHVQHLDLKIHQLDAFEYSRIFDRAEKRIQEAVKEGVVSFQKSNDEIEILSFPVAVMIVAYLNNSSLKRRYALAEAKRASNLLKQEDEQKLLFVAELFDWKIKSVKIYDESIQATIPNFLVNFVRYLKNTSIFHESKWKLVNRTLQNGEVYLRKNEVARLLSEEVRRYVERKLDQKIDFVLSDTITARADKLKKLYDSLMGKKHEDEMPKETIVDAFPPCINRLYNTALAKQHLSHIERFTLTSFLINSGVPVENVIEFFRPTSDFSEKMTRYQVEHIAGRKGSRTKYKPPKCETLRTHNVCFNMDEICRQIHNPITYYKKKLRIIKTAKTQTSTRK
jgi:DNA primase large subunit